MAIIEGEGSIEDYRRVSAALDFDVTPPPGLILHAITELDDGLQAVDVWESSQAAQDFYEDRLRPTMAEVAPELPQFPPPEMHEVADLVHP